MISSPVALADSVRSSSTTPSHRAALFASSPARRAACSTGRPMVFGRGVNPINFVSVVDLAALVALAADDRTTRGEILEIGGPPNLTFTELARMVQVSGGRHVGPRHLPPLILRLARATVGKLRPQIGRQTGMALALDSNDFTFDSTAIHQRFPTLPTSASNDLLLAHLARQRPAIGAPTQRLPPCASAGRVSTIRTGDASRCRPPAADARVEAADEGTL